MTDDLRIQLQEQARQAKFWRSEAERWQKLWERAADRIEAQAAEIERLRGELVKAVEALERVFNSQPRPKRNGDYDRSDVFALQRIARTTLAALTGGQKDGN